MTDCGNAHYWLYLGFRCSVCVGYDEHYLVWKDFERIEETIVQPKGEPKRRVHRVIDFKWN